MKDISSIYIHIPFCKNICTYCDFCKMYYNEKEVNDYLESLEKEINKYYKHELINTLYIGGGTPSSLKKEQLNKLFSIINKIKFDNNGEFTFECNIEDIDKLFLEFLLNNKVNRLSIGVESFNEQKLMLLGRKTTIDIKSKILLAKQYIDNISVDLMYGLNGETLEILKNDLNSIIDLDIKHISIYSLILEEHTILRNKNYKEISDDECRIMYDYIVKKLESNDFHQYEISNFSKNGYESRHNLNYWNNNKYYGFGLGASGYIKDIRYNNTRSIKQYKLGRYRIQEEKISKRIDMENEMMLNLRTIKGISKKAFKEKYNQKINEIFNVQKLKENKDYFYIDKDELYISNSILVDFIQLED